MIGSMTLTSHQVPVIHLALGSRLLTLEYWHLQATSISCCPASPNSPPHFSQLPENTAMGKMTRLQLHCHASLSSLTHPDICLEDQQIPPVAQNTVQSPPRGLPLVPFHSPPVHHLCRVAHNHSKMSCLPSVPSSSSHLGRQGIYVF